MVIDNRSSVLEAFSKIGIPDDFTAPLRSALVEEERVRGQQYRPEREQAELQRITEATARRLVEVHERLVADVEREKNAELGKVLAEQRARTALPLKSLGDTDTEHQTRLVAKLIEETRAAARLTAASTDVALIGMLDDPAALSDMLADALEGDDPAVIRRVSRAVEQRLARLEAAEYRRTQTPGGPLSKARSAGQGQIDAWRKSEASRSPAARRQQIEEHAARRKADIERHVDRIGGHFVGLKQALRVAAARARK